MGAGGESLDKNNTIFDRSLKSFSKYVKKSPELDINIAFNGGHSETEKILNNSFPSTIPKRGFSSQDYNDIIEQYKNKLLNNEFHAGDQFMILSTTHGFKKQDSAASNTHFVSSSDGAVDIDKLSELKQLAKEKGVKMAIVDLSCYSGNTLNLADNNTCVITAASAGRVAISTFVENFMLNMKKGRSLEDVFLSARENERVGRLSSPTISTDIGMDISTSLNDEIQMAMDKNSSIDPKNNIFDFKQYYTESLYNVQNAERMCANEVFFKSTLDYLGKMENLYSDTKRSFWFWKRRDNKYAAFKQALAEYKDYLDLSAQINKKLVEKEKEFGPLHVKNEYSPTTWSDLLFDADKSIKALKKEFYSGKSTIKESYFVRNIAYYEDLKNVRKKILEQYPDLNLLLKKYEKLNFERLSANVVHEEQKLYQKNYKELKSQQVSSNNPCSDFKL